MQELQEWLSSPVIHGEVNYSVREKVKKLLIKEREQIEFAFNSGKCRAYGVADNTNEVMLPHTFYDETYNNE